MVQCVVTHRLVSAQSDQIVQRIHLAPERLVKQPEKERDWRRARAVGDEYQHPLPLQFYTLKRPEH